MGDEGLAAAVRALADRAAITDVLLRYARAVDRSDLATIAACFTDDAEVSYGGVDFGPGGDQVVAHFQEFAEQRPSSASTHLVGNVLVELDGDQAEVESYTISYVVLEGATTETMRVHGVRYLDRFVRTPEGWRITRRVHTNDWALTGTPTFATPRAERVV